MANPTTNYGFVLPTSSDLVTDLPADFDVALQGVDTRLKALNPSTTLGDIEYASATANTNTRLAIGTTGQVLTVAGGVPSWAAVGSPSFNTGYNFVGAGQETSSSTFTNLATVQSVTVTTGTKVLVTISASYENGTAARQAQISFDVTGASSLGASIARGAETGTANGGNVYQSICYASVITGLTAGSNTFTMKFASPTANPAYFRDRTISVVNLGS
jgi:hypothetical protein